MEETEITTSTRSPLTSLIDYLRLKSPNSPHFLRLKSTLSKFPITPRFLLNIDEIRRHDPILASSIISSPSDYISPFEEEFQSVIHSNSVLSSLYNSAISPSINNSTFKITDSSVYLKCVKKEPLKFSIGFYGNLGPNELTPSTIRSSFLMKLIKVSGIVTRASNIFPKARSIFHYCPKTGESFTKNYRDSSDLGKIPTSTAFSTKDEEGNPLTTEFGISNFEDTQYIQIQDLPEDNSKAALGGSVTVLLTADLVDKCKPGDRVVLYGVIRALGGKANGVYRSITKTCIIANNLTVYSTSTFAFKSLKSNQNLSLTATNLELHQIFENFFNVEVSSNFFTSLNIHNKEQLNFYFDYFSPNSKSNKISVKTKIDKLLNVLSESAFPHIKGYSNVKKAVLLQLLGGNQIITNTKTRGDIHILLLGDPSTAKSQILRSTLNFASCAISASGRGSSGVGLTAVVKTNNNVKHSLTDDSKTVEAGAMVRADKGIICIDEFDKMTDYDRVALHEVMEQQTVTIAKAGLHMQLNARCSVLAAANPLYSTYDTSKSVEENVNLPDSLLSRFDLIFVILDEHDNNKDLEIAKHVINNRMTTRKKGKLSFRQINNILRICKFISKPKLNNESKSIIKSCYKVLRKSENAKFVLPITPRVLEGVIRLSTAVAKLKLKDEVEKEDCVEAIKIVENSLNVSILENLNLDFETEKEEEVERKEIKKKKKIGTGNKWGKFKEVYGKLSENETFLKWRDMVKGVKEGMEIEEEEIEEFVEKLKEEEIVIVTGKGEGRNIYRV